MITQLTKHDREMGSDDKLAESNGSSGGRTPPGYNQTKRQWARGFLWVTAILLLFDRPLLSLGTSASAVYTMHGGTILSHKNFKWSCASAISFLVSLYALTLRTESKFVDGERAYELKATLNLKHRAAEIIWGGILLLFLGLTVKEKIDNAIESTASAVKNISSSMGGSDKQKKT